MESRQREAPGTWRERPRSSADPFSAAGEERHCMEGKVDLGESSPLLQAKAAMSHDVQDKRTAPVCGVLTKLNTVDPNNIYISII